MDASRAQSPASPYEVPGRAELPGRLESVLQAATQGPSFTRDDLCAEALRLGRLVVELLEEPEALGLLARCSTTRGAPRASTPPGISSASRTDGPEGGLVAIDAELAQGGLDGCHLAHAARADMQRRLGLLDAARASYERALALTRQPAERRFLEARLAQLSQEPAGGTPPRRART